MLNSILKVLLPCFSGLILVATSNAQPQSGCKKDSTYAECQEATKSRIIFKYLDPTNGLLWTSALPGTYSNGCVDRWGEWDSGECTTEIGSDGSLQVVTENSAAEKACQNLSFQDGTLVGTRLPTKFEYISLVRSMGLENEAYRYSSTDPHEPILTKKGTAKMQDIFGDMGRDFWSSSLREKVFAYTFDGSLGGYWQDQWGHIINAKIRDEKLAVRCVKQK